MPFRIRQRLFQPGYNLTTEEQLIVGENGCCERVSVAVNKQLPDVSLFDPTACVKAKVNLEKLNTKVFGADFTGLAASPESSADDSADSDDTQTSDTEN